MKYKKSQGAIEFMIILTFVFVIITFVMYLSGGYLVDLNNKKQERSLEHYADRINTELRLLSKVESGYSRDLVLYELDYEVEIVKSIVDNTPTILKIRSVNLDKNYTFDLVGNYNLDAGLLEVNSTKQYDSDLKHNVTIISFKKKAKREVQQLDIS